MKLIALGESHVGKSCLIRRYTTDRWAPTFITTIGIDVQKVRREIEGRQYQLQIWDTAGQERFRSITLNYVHGAHGVLLVYDLTDRKTFEAVRVWAQRLNEMAGDRLALVVVGNKSDMCEESPEKRRVTEEEGQAVATELHAGFLETSAKAKIRVDEAFEMLAQRVRTDVFKEGAEEDPKQAVRIGQSSSRRRPCCQR